VSDADLLGVVPRFVYGVTVATFAIIAANNNDDDDGNDNNNNK